MPLLYVCMVFREMFPRRDSDIQASAPDSSQPSSCYHCLRLLVFVFFARLSTAFLPKQLLLSVPVSVKKSLSFFTFFM